MTGEPDDRWLSTTEAIAGRLGVKHQTLYAYVSRGLIAGTPEPGSRTSRYSRRDVERLAGHGRARPGRPGPEIVIDQAITALDPAGHLAYRGWDTTRAAVDAHYEQVAAWLWGTTFGPNDHWTADPDGLAVDPPGRAGRAPGGDAAARTGSASSSPRSAPAIPARRPARARPWPHAPPHSWPPSSRHCHRSTRATRRRRPAHWRDDSGHACRPSNR